MKKESLYYYDKPNIFRPNNEELNTKMFNCPRCKKKLSIPRSMSSNPSYICPNCGIKIPFENVLHTRDKVEEYMVEQKRRITDEVMKESVFLKESPKKKVERE